MSLQKISFEHFYIETVNFTDQKYAVLLNPYSMGFFKCGNVYLALTLSDILTVNFAINTGKRDRNNINWIDILISEAKKVNLSKISFITSINNKIVQNIAKKYDCKLINTNKNYYSGNEDALVYELELNKDN